MHRWPLLVLLLASACARPPQLPVPQHDARHHPPTRTISIVATSDVHGHVESLPWLAGHVRNLRQVRRATGGDVLLVDAGDMWQGTLESNLSEGAAMVRAYNALGFDAVAIGNHEFDFGPVGPAAVPRHPSDNPTGALEQRAREARHPFLAANLRTLDDRPWTPANVRPATLVTVAGVQVGLIGVTTITTPRATDPRNLVKLRVVPLLEAVTREAARLRASGATVVVLLAHAGGGCKAFDNPDDVSSCGPRGEVFQLARALPPGLVDAIAAGHAHFGIAHRVNGVAIVEAFNLGRAFGRVDLEIDPASGRVRNQRIFPPQYLCNGRTLAAVPSWAADACQPPAYEGQPVRQDRRIVALLRRDVAAAARRRAQSLGVVAAKPYPHSTRGESPASHLVVDLLRAAAAGTDVVIYNATGTRADLDAGPITYADLYELLPFDSVVASATLPAAAVARAILNGVTAGPAPIVSGIEADVTCAAGLPRVTLSRGGQVLPDDALLTVATSEFLSSGGAGYFPDMEEQFTLHLDKPMREVIAAILPGQAEAIARGEVGGFDAGRPRIRTPDGTLPVRCTP